jgi:hypothetical protein
MADMSDIPGITELRQVTLGDPRIRIAVLDGFPDLDHPELKGARIQVSNPCNFELDTVKDVFRSHATFLASQIFGNLDGKVPGIAPLCSGEFIVAAHSETDFESGALSVARAVEYAIQMRVHILHCAVSLTTQTGSINSIVEKAFESARKAGILIVNPVGNDHGTTYGYPAIEEFVLAVGNVNDSGEPADSTNFGALHEGHGVMANGTNILGAQIGGGVGRERGTSLSAPIVSAVAALILSKRISEGKSLDPMEVGRAIIASATPYRGEFQDECIGGILNPMGALEMVESGSVPAPFGTDTVKVGNPRSAPGLPPRSRVNWMGKKPRGVEQSAKEAESEAESVEQSLRVPTFVFALGSVGFEIPTDLAYEALEQERTSAGIEGSVADAGVMGQLLAERPSLGERLTWLLEANGEPLYALEPEGPLAAEIYLNLAEALTAQVLGEVDTVSIPGLRISAQRSLRDGTRVPRVTMDVVRGLYAWTVESSVDSSGLDVDSREILLSILRAIKDESRNDGAGGPARTLNYLMANPVQLAMSAVSAQREGFTFGGLNILRSTFSRPYSDCWDIELVFVDTEDEFRAGLIHRHTVDVADIMPVSVGKLKAWRAL